MRGMGEGKGKGKGKKREGGWRRGGFSMGTMRNGRGSGCRVKCLRSKWATGNSNWQQYRCWNCPVTARVLDIKRGLGLFERRTVALDSIPLIVGSKAFQDAADDIAQRSLTLVRDSAGTVARLRQ